MQDIEREAPTLFTEAPAWDDKRMVERNECAFTLLTIAQCRGIRPANQLRPVAMHNLGKGSWQRVLDVIQERRVSIEVGESLCFKFKALATKVIVNKFKHRALGGIGRIYGRKRSQDRLLI